MRLETFDRYGYYCEKTEDYIKNFDRKMINVLNCLSYIPLISTIVGIVKLIWGLTFKKSSILLTSNIVRISLEILSFGFLFIIPDLIITINRSNKN